MSEEMRFTIKPIAWGTVYVLQVRKSCTASIAQDWLAKHGITVNFKRRGWWYEASWGDSRQAEAVAPLLHTGSPPWDLPEPIEQPKRTHIPYALIAGIAAEFGCVECWWRESDHSFTGFVTEVWFNELPGEFAIKWASVVGYQVKVRRRERGPATFAVSIPCVLPE